MDNYWQEIWEKKYADGRVSHKNDGFDSLSYEQWGSLVRKFISLIEIGEKDDVLDVGVGSGAFLKEFKKYGSISGIDRAESAIDICNRTFDGTFKVGEANSLPFAKGLFSIVISFSVFHYFPSLVYAESVVKEMIRVLRKSGSILIADVNDSAKMAEYHSIRQSENMNRNHIYTNIAPTHLFYEKSFFEELAFGLGLDIHIIDNTALDIPFYTQSNYRFTVILKS